MLGRSYTEYFAILSIRAFTNSRSDHMELAMFRWIAMGVTQIISYSVRNGFHRRRGVEIKAYPPRRPFFAPLHYADTFTLQLNIRIPCFAHQHFPRYLKFRSG